jgi:hypothetical protein
MILVSFSLTLIDHIIHSFLSEENKKQTEQTNDTFSARMKLQILQNLELSIHNIHIVYEDKTTKPDHPFSFGITLNSITLHVEIHFEYISMKFIGIFRQRIKTGYRQ